MQERRPARFQSLPQRRLELLVAPNRKTEHAACLRHGREVDRSELRGEAAGRTTFLLMPPDRAVAAVVEDERHYMSPLANGRLQLGHGHGESAVTSQRHSRSTRPCQRCADGRGKPIAHGSGRRTEEGARPAETIAPGRPRPKIARVGRQHGLRRQHPGQRRDDTPRMYARTVPGLRIDDRGGFVRRPIKRVCGCSLVERSRL